MNKIVYAALLIGLTSSVADAARVRDTAPLACTGTPSQTCTDAANAYNAVMSIPGMITQVQDEATKGSTGNPTYQTAQTLLASNSGFSNYVNNCKTNPPASGTPQATACTNAETAWTTLNTAVSTLDTDLGSASGPLTIFAGTIAQQQNDTGMASLATLVNDLNSLDSAVTAANQIPVPSGPTAVRKK